MDNFIKISQQLGKNILYVQGAGGNTSIKINDKLYIKASGEKLKNMTKTNGFVCCTYQPLANYFIGKKKISKLDEYQFLELVDDSLIKEKSFGKPSMEVGFHAVIPSKYVLHLHSMYTNMFTCMKYGSQIIKKLFKDVPNSIIEYKNPGYELAYVLSKEKSLPSLIFLKNHGIIVHGDNLQTCVSLIEEVHHLIEEYLKLHKTLMQFKPLTQYIKMQKYIIPDSAVFSHIKVSTLSQKKQKELLEITSMQRYITETIKKLGKSPAYLRKRDVNKLLAMKQEKYRQNLFKN